MKNCMNKTMFREIGSSLGRHLAIFAIVALGVGFFAGLRVTTPGMIEAGDKYIKENALYDFRLLHTLGFEEEDVEKLLEDEDIETAEGAVWEDFIIMTQTGESYVLKAHSLTQNVNKVVLLEGRMPQTDQECLIDRRALSLTGLTDFTVGDILSLKETNTEDTLEAFTYEEYTVVGIVDSPYYLNYERGTSGLGSGKVSGFVYMPLGGFTAEYYSEVFVTLKQQEELFSDEYDEMIEAKEGEMEEVCEALAYRRYDSIVADAEAEVEDAREELREKKADAEEELADAYDELVSAGEELDENESKLASKERELNAQEQNLSAIPEEMRPPEAIAAIQRGRVQIRNARKEIEDAREELAEGWEEYEDSKREFEEEIADVEKEIADAEEEIADIEEPDSFVLGRDSNVGYVCFESDSDIVRSISTVFPLFFFLVAALVCMTTMNRMVEEQRTQIGVLKALGYSDGRVMWKYIFYALSAAVLGGIVGFTGGSYLFPKVIWFAYDMMYGFADIEYLFDIPLFLVSMAAALLCSVGATYFTCRSELKSSPAALIRPKAPKSGKRILLERIGFIWNRLKFLQKVSVRNLFRYKKRFFMMIVGISGCTALLVTGFGIKDSISGTVGEQYDEIQTYDALISFDKGLNAARQEAFAEEIDEVSDDLLCVREEAVQLATDQGDKECTLVVPETIEGLDAFLDLHTTEGDSIAYPEKGEAVLCRKLSERYGIKVGDVLTFRDGDMHIFTCTVSGVCENFVYNYVYINEETYKEAVGEEPEFAHAFVKIKNDLDLHEAAAFISEADHVAGVSINQDFRERFDNMIGSLNYIVILVILCAGALAFIVLYNLTNINITERIREIATIKVLGFYPGETASYVFRENFVLTAIGAALGLVLGIYLHWFVMYNIDLDQIAFHVHISTLSFVYSFCITFLFTVIVDIVMYFKLDQINMVESLKSIE